MSIKTKYKTARNATWVYYLIALFFFVLAVMQFPTSQNPGGSMNLFIFWTALATGTVYGAGRNKRKAAKKAQLARM